MKKCPYCMAEIPVEARKCKFCGEWVEPRESAGAEPPELKVTVQSPSRGPRKACPYCAAQIPEGAWTCMYCKRSVLGGKPMAVGMGVLAGFFVLIFFFGFWVPGCIEVERKHKEFDQKWNKTPWDEGFRPGR